MTGYVKNNILSLLALTIAVILIIAAVSVSYMNYRRIKAMPPSVLNVRVNDDVNITILSGATVTLSAYVDDSMRGDSVIMGANYTIGYHNWPSFSMEAGDGQFNETTEQVSATVDTTGWTDGMYRIYVHGYDERGNCNYTPSESVTLIVSDPPGIDNILFNGQANLSVNPGTEIVISATVDDSESGNSHIKSAFVSIGDVRVKMEPVDDVYDSPTEGVHAVFYTSNWTDGHFEVRVNALDDLGDNATFSSRSAFLTVSEPPLISNVKLSNESTVSVAPGVTVELTATVDDTMTGNSSISNVWFRIGNSTSYSMEPVDGRFDTPLEDVRASIETDGLQDDIYGIHLFVGDTYGGSNITASNSTLLTVAAPPMIYNVTIANLSETIVVPGAIMEVRAVVDDVSTGNTVIKDAYVSIENQTGFTITMNPRDGTFDSSKEEVYGTIDTSLWPNGTYVIRVHGSDEMNNTNQTGGEARITLTAPFRMGSYDLRLPDYPDRAYTWESLSDVITVNVDPDGIPMSLFNGNFYYHPVAIAQYALRMIDSFMISGNGSYFSIAKSCLHRLINEAHEIDGALYAPYQFDFALHGHADQMMVAPWFSGMAQGQLLSLLSRVYNLTGDEYYIEVTEKVFRSFYNLEGQHSTWTVYHDEQDYYWISEYPMEEKTQVLNGFVWGTYGLLDYYFLMNGSLFVSQLLNAALTTIQDHVHLYRRVGNVSIYCLKHQVVSESYHMIHVDQQETLYYYSNEIYFQEMSVNFYNDWH